MRPDRVTSGPIIDIDITWHPITFAGQAAALVVAQDIVADGPRRESPLPANPLEPMRHAYHPRGRS
jgi:hypothetical protein